jgi:hypothetical protein
VGKPTGPTAKEKEEEEAPQLVSAVFEEMRIS